MKASKYLFVKTVYAESKVTRKLRTHCAISDVVSALLKIPNDKTCFMLVLKMRRKHLWDKRKIKIRKILDIE
jgi:hypothetical protein